jgi:hypothetical protein
MSRLFAILAMAQAQFFALADDVPLPEGFAETTAPAAFAAPGGRVLQMEASGVARAQDVAGFYAEALPQLGWTPSPGEAGAAAGYVRGRETLTLDVTDAGEGSVRISVLIVAQPASAALD